ncbi:MAG: hypothetical protein GX078_01385 [Clostridiales bacterium]|nr:hypothetical protein [Clostridiales bacterium]
MNKRNSIMIFITVIALIVIAYTVFKPEVVIEAEQGYVSSNINAVKAFDEDEKSVDIFRGTKVNYYKEKNKTIDETELIEIDIKDKIYYIQIDNICTSKEDIVKEKEIYTRTPSSLTKEDDSIVGFTDKGSKLEVVTYKGLDKEGNVLEYLVKSDDIKGYIKGEYVVLTEKESQKRFEPETYDSMHLKAENKYGGGDAMKLDYYPKIKPSFKDNPMPKHCYSLYLSATAINPESIKPFIAFAKDTLINTFVIDIKDNFIIGYPAKAMEKYSPSAAKAAYNSYDEYKEAVKMLKDEGFYVVGRITVFKDDRYVSDHPEDAIVDKDTHKPYKHEGSYWPTGYSRNVWEYNVALAKESVTEIGFNEINFDYCRFPDRIINDEKNLNMRNEYGEDKAQAIQRFLIYAADSIHKLNAYVSVDVFGETSNGTYTSPYGQYWPAMSNVVDVISAMPYPDHFGAGSYGISKPWNEPYALMNSWGKFAAKRQKECPTPAKVRTWIQAYNVLPWVDTDGIRYNAEELEEEIRGLYDAGIGDGYITWHGGPSLEKYNLQKAAFQIDYVKE